MRAKEIKCPDCDGTGKVANGQIVTADTISVQTQESGCVIIICPTCKGKGTIMAKRMTEAQANHLLKAMNLTYSPLPLDDPKLFGFQHCDRCGKETPSGQYVDETDQWLCNDCLVRLQEAAEADEHSRKESEE